MHDLACRHSRGSIHDGRTESNRLFDATAVSKEGQKRHLRPALQEEAPGVPSKPGLSAQAPTCYYGRHNSVRHAPSPRLSPLEEVDGETQIPSPQCGGEGVGEGDFRSNDTWP